MTLSSVPMTSLTMLLKKNLLPVQMRERKPVLAPIWKASKLTMEQMPLVFIIRLVRHCSGDKNAIYIAVLLQDSDSTDSDAPPEEQSPSDMMGELAIELVKILHPYPKECGKRVAKFIQEFSSKIDVIHNSIKLAMKRQYICYVLGRLQGRSMEGLPDYVKMGLQRYAWHCSECQVLQKKDWGLFGSNVGPDKSST